MAKLMVQSGVGDLEVAVTAGSQKVLNSLHMGIKLEHLYDGCRHLQKAGFKGASDLELLAEFSGRD